MSKQADRIRASAASLADLEEDFSTPAPKTYPVVTKTLPLQPESSQPSAAGKPAVIVPAPNPAPAPVEEASVAEAAEIQAKTVAHRESGTEERVTRREGRRATKTQTQRLPPSRAGKVPVNIWTSKAKRQALKVYAVTHETTLEELMNEGLDDLLKKHRIRVN